jgi:hypothetical protein
MAPAIAAEPGRSSDATQCRVEPGERWHREVPAGLISQGWRDVQCVHDYEADRQLERKGLLHVCATANLSSGDCAWNTNLLRGDLG